MTDDQNFISDKVRQYYWVDDINCATTMLKILSEVFNIIIEQQVIDCALGMHGAGEYGAQCGLVEGTLMFIGIFGKHHNIAQDIIIQKCHEYARNYEQKYSSLQCKELRPAGFKKDNPPHLCEPLTCEVTNFSIEFISQIMDELDESKAFPDE